MTDWEEAASSRQVPAARKRDETYEPRRSPGGGGEAMQARVGRGGLAVEIRESRHDAAEGARGEPAEHEQQGDRDLVGRTELDVLVHEERRRHHDGVGERPDARPSPVVCRVEPATMQVADGKRLGQRLVQLANRQSAGGFSQRSR